MSTLFMGDIVVAQADVFALSTQNITDISLLDKIIFQATSAIEAMTGVFFKSADRGDMEVTTSDAAWLRKAAIFQTVWLYGQVETLERQGVSSISQDGLSLQAPDGLTFVLAPMAKRALNNCSWAKSGTIKVTAPSQIPAASALVSDNHPWYPMAGA